MTNCPNIPNIYYSQKDLKHFGLAILVTREILEHIVLNIALNVCTKIKKKINYSQRFLNYNKCQNTFKLYTSKALLSKKSILFLFSHPLAKFRPSIGKPRYCH